MTRGRAAFVFAILAGTAVLVAGQTPPARAPQTFRSATDVVMVDVSVRTGGRVVAGLTADDFVVTDNGVRQRIESVEATAVPIDLTLVVDSSGNYRRPWLPRTKPSAVADDVREELRKVTELLRPTDRVRLLVMDGYVHQVWPLLPVSALPAIRELPFDGMASLYDTLAAALLQPVEPARRHVVVARTKGIDTISSIDVAAVRAIAEESDALFHLVIMETVLDNEDEFVQFQSRNMDLRPPTHRFWLPRMRRLVGGRPTHIVTPEGLVVKAGVEATGGGWHQASGLTEPSLPGTFKDTFDNFRQNYVLRYTPQGVARAGWHAIRVTVPKLRGATINARRGYGIEEPVPAAAPVPIPTVPKSLSEVTRAYEAGAYRNVVAGLSQVADPPRFMREFEEAGNPWPASPKREAAFAIEVAETGLFAPRAPVREQAEALLERFTRLVRPPLEPDEFERYWHFAVLTLLQGTLRPSVTEAFVARALARFPDEPQFQLARAIVADQRSAATGSPRMAASTPAARTHLAAARDLYEAALAWPTTATEARLRLAYLLHRIGEDRDALARLDEAGTAPTQDGSLRYLHQLFRGYALDALGRSDEAIAAYRAALVLLPSAQSARVSLMNALFKRGDRAEAEALAERVQTEASSAFDPWWTYWQGQHRVYPQAMARLRELAR